METLRETLYPLGFIAALLFAGRFIYQWVESEWKRESVVSPTFWKISLLGNSSLWLHALVQGQLPIVLFQTINAIISWRNINLHQDRSRHHPLQAVFLFFLLGLFSTLFAFAITQWFFDGAAWKWHRIPKTPWAEEVPTSNQFWEMIGLIGYGIFSSRFWFQWWEAERQKKSVVGPFFWWYSLLGALLASLYFGKIGDWVQFVGPALGLIPYARNLVIVRKQAGSQQRLE